MLRQKLRNSQKYTTRMIIKVTRLEEITLSNTAHKNSNEANDRCVANEKEDVNNIDPDVYNDNEK